MSKVISKERASHPVARVSGVKPTDTRVEAAEKVLATMRLAGFDPKAIRKAERMVAEIKRRDA